MLVKQQLPRLLQPPRQSFFLFGPRGTGKSTWLERRMLVYPRTSRLTTREGVEVLDLDAFLAELERGL